MTDTTSPTDLPAIKSEPLDDLNPEFGSTGCIKIETVHGFQIKTEVDEEEPIKFENSEAVITYVNPEENYPVTPAITIRNIEELQKEPAQSQQARNTSEILAKLQNSSQIVIKKSTAVKSASNPPASSLKAIQDALINAKKSEITASITEPADKPFVVIHSMPGGSKGTTGSKNVSLAAKLIQNVLKSQDLAAKIRKSPDATTSTPKPVKNYIKTLPVKFPVLRAPKNVTSFTKTIQIPEPKVHKLPQAPKAIKSSSLPTTSKSPATLTRNVQIIPKNPKVFIKKNKDLQNLKKLTQIVRKGIEDDEIKNLEQLAFRNLKKKPKKTEKVGAGRIYKIYDPEMAVKQEKEDEEDPSYGGRIGKESNPGGVTTRQLRPRGVNSKESSLKESVLEEENPESSISMESSQKVSIPKESSMESSQATIATSISMDLELSALNSPESSIKIKEEPLDEIPTILPDVNIKEEPENIIDDQESSSQFIISSIKSELFEDDYQYEDSQYDYQESLIPKEEPDEELFQYNVVNSFKSDLATRRNVSHTVVSGKQSKTQEEIAELARQELLKLEQEKANERERAAVAQAKAMELSESSPGPSYVARPIATPLQTTVRKPGRPPGSTSSLNHQCPICLIRFKTPEQLVAHKRLHDKSKAPLNTAEMTKNVYVEVKMKIEQIGSRRSIHVLLPNYDFAFIVTNSTATKLYMKCFRQNCDVKAYSTTDGKFFLKKGEKHSHGPDRDVILNKISAAKISVLQKTEVINRQVHQAILEKQMQKSSMEVRQNMLIERIKKTHEAAVKKERDEDEEVVVKRRKLC